jgi:murein DD-endopeptidase MepM/ murein hydrolase activator NlpD
VGLPVVLLVGLAARSNHAEWGSEDDEGGPAAALFAARADLAEIVHAKESMRAAMIERFAASRAVSEIEPTKRFRNPELRPLFQMLLRHSDWHVVHRALLALERMDDASAFPKALALLRHAEPRIREKAAIACLTLWERAAATPGVVPNDVAAAIASLLATEGDPQVRSSLEAMARRAAGILVVDKVADEVRVADPDGLVWTPLLCGMGEAKRVAPAYEAQFKERTSDTSAATLPVAVRWTLPLLGFGREEVPRGFALQPFGHVRNHGATYHTGEDVGAFLDGAGLYACADGIVRLVYTGSDMGTEIVVEHRLTERELVTVLYMHAAGVVFVRAGDHVAAGQLMGSMGLGLSFENGGHFAHLHLGVYPGPFRDRHNYGYSPVSWGLRDWYDPAIVLPEWVERTRPPVDDVGFVVPSLAPVAALVRGGQYAKALAKVDAALASPPIDPGAQADAQRIRKALVAAGPGVVARATAWRERGFPTEARALLAREARRLAGVPGGDEPEKVGAAWDADPAFARDLAAEAAFVQATSDEAPLLERGNVDSAVELWERVQDECAGTCLALRVQSRLFQRATR